jgi:hypothetical protein
MNDVISLEQETENTIRTWIKYMILNLKQSRSVMVAVRRPDCGPPLLHTLRGHAVA